MGSIDGRFHLEGQMCSVHITEVGCVAAVDTIFPRKQKRWHCLIERRYLATALEFNMYTQIQILSLCHCLSLNDCAIKVALAVNTGRCSNPFSVVQ